MSATQSLIVLFLVAVAVCFLTGRNGATTVPALVASFAFMAIVTIAAAELLQGEGEQIRR